MAQMIRRSQMLVTMETSLLQADYHDYRQLSFWSTLVVSFTSWIAFWEANMHLFSIAVLRNDVQPAVQLSSAQDLSTFGFFQRSSVGEFMNFFSKTVAERTKAGQRQDVEENGLIPFFAPSYQIMLAMCTPEQMG
jgi:hypothetical protein